MRRVQLHGVETRLHHAPCGLGELLHDPDHLVGCQDVDGLHLLIRVGVDDGMALRPRQAHGNVVGGLLAVARKGRLAAGVLQLRGALCAVAVHGRGKPRKAGDVRVIVRHQVGHRGAVCQVIGRRGSHDNEPGSAPGNGLVVGNVPAADGAVDMRRADVGGDMADAVWNLDSADPDRLEHVCKRSHIVMSSSAWA